MMNKLTISSDKAEVGELKKEKQETWSQSSRTGDSSKTVNVEKLYNKGFLVTIDISYKDAKDNYQYIRRKVYSDTNPLEEDTTSPADKLVDMLLRKEEK